SSGLIMLDPLGYNEFLYLWKDAALVLTDSGGLQEETTALKIPCITMRENTERPITADCGSNEIAGTDTDKIYELGKKALSGRWKDCRIPEMWDGKASERIAEILLIKQSDLEYVSGKVPNAVV
ncbi:MAG: UDP-N-acetyl glucosamine 2-epimerase, partial [Clostridiaceae bacterium]|nr:UDP-N-acetyl glucosamine 2-epimerase [Clostridiaceae bacterium]